MIIYVKSTVIPGLGEAYACGGGGVLYSTMPYSIVARHERSKRIEIVAAIHDGQDEFDAQKNLWKYRLMDDPRVALVESQGRYVHVVEIRRGRQNEYIDLGLIW
jgi:hypothetical protein